MKPDVCDKGAPAPALPEAMRTALEALIAANQLELPMLPEVASKVITLSMDEKAEMAQLTQTIQRDQPMTAHLLRISNSALYAPPTPIVSLQQACNRLGMKKIREIALLISCQNAVFRVEGFDLRVRQAFKHSIAAATYAQEIAKLRRWNVEEAFLCGLMADLGRPVMLQALVKLKKKLEVECERAAMEAAAAEFHSFVGSELVKAWRLPARISETILFHHDPEKAPTAAQTAMLTRLSADLAHWIVGPRAFTEEGLRAHPLLAPLNIYPEEMETLIARRTEVQRMVESVA